MKNVLVGLVVISLFRAVASGPAATLTVTNSADSGDGTLRQAIADAAPGDMIDFSITGTSAVWKHRTILPPARLASLPMERHGEHQRDGVKRFISFSPV